MDWKAGLRKVGPSLLVFLVSLGYFMPFYDKGVDFNDEGATLYIADRVAQGDLLYKDAWWPWTPGVYYLLALSFKLLGTSIWTGRVVTALFGALTSVVIYRLASLLVSRPLSLLPSALFVVWGLPFHFQPYHSWLALFFSLCSILTLCYYIRSKNTRSLLIAGMLSGITAFFKINYGGITYLSIAAYLLLTEFLARREGKVRMGAMPLLRGIAILSAGALTVLGPVSLYFYMKGNLWEMVQAVFFHLEIRQTISYVIPGPWEAIRDFSLARPYNLMMYLPVPIFLGALLLSARGDKVREGRLLLLYLYALLFLYTAYPQLNWVHFVQVLVPVYLLLALLIDEAVWRAQMELGDRKRAHMAILVLLALLSVSLLVVGAKNRIDLLGGSNYTIKLDIPRGDIYISKAEIENEHIMEILSFMKVADGEVFIIPNQPLFYFLADRKSPSRFLYSNYATTKEMEREQMEDLERGRVPYIVFFKGSAFTDWGTGRTFFDLTDLRSYIYSYYAVVDYHTTFYAGRDRMNTLILNRVGADSTGYGMLYLPAPDGWEGYLTTREVHERLKEEGLLDEMR